MVSISIGGRTISIGKSGISVTPKKTTTPAPASQSKVTIGQPASNPFAGGQSSASAGSGSSSSVSTSGSSNKVGGGGGVYNASTNTYTDSSGNKFSTTTAPTGALVVGGTVNPFTGANTSGGGGGSSKVVTPTTTTNFNQVVGLKNPVQVLEDMKTNAVSSSVVKPTTIPPVDTSLMTPAQKAKYYYEQADIAVGGWLPTGITPTQATARNNAQRNAEQYSELLKKDLTEVVGLAVGGEGENKLQQGVNFIKNEYLKGGNRYNPKVVQKVLEVKILEKLKNNYTNEVIPKIENEKGTYNSQVENLQKDYESGKITYEDALKLNDELYASYEQKVKSLDKEWQEGKGKQLLEGYTDIARQVGIAQSLKGTFSAGKVALFAGTSAVAGAGLVKLTAVGEGVGRGATIARDVVSGVSLFGKAGLAVGAGTSLFSLGSTYVERGKVDKYDVAGALLPIVGYSIIGIASGYAGAKVYSANQQKALIAKTDVKARAFQKELNKPQNLERYFTKENIQRGYVEKTIDGVKYQFKISETARVRLLAQREGVTIKTDILTGGAEVKGVIKNELIAQLNVDKTASVSKITQSQYTKITGQQVGKNVELYSVTQGSSTNRVGYIVSVDKSGNIKSALAMRQVIDPTKGTSFIETAKINLKPNVAMKGGLKFEGITIEGNPRLFVTKAEQVAVQNIGERGSIVKTKLFSKEIKGSDIMRGRTTEIFGKRNELVSEWFARKPTYKIDTTKIFPEVKVGSSTRITSTKDVLGLKRDLFLETLRTTTKPTPSTFDIKNVRPMKSWSITDPTGATGTNQQGLIQSLQRSVGMVAPTPKLTPPRTTFPTIVQADGGGQSLFSATAGLSSGGLSSVGGLIFNKPIDRKDSVTPPDMLNVGERGLIKVPIIDKIEEPTKEKSLFGFSYVPSSRTGISQIITPITTPQQKIEPKTEIFPIIKQEMPQRTINPPRPIIDKPFGFGLPFAPKLGGVEVGGGQRVPKDRTGLFGKTQYNPSLGSVLTRAKAKKVTEKEFIALTNKKYKGLGLRPRIIVVK